MSIIIKGMDMPERGRITIQIGADGSVYSISSCNITAEKYEKHFTALDIPPRGRLIDAETLIAQIMNEMRRFNYDETKILTLASVIKMVDELQTIDAKKKGHWISAAEFEECSVCHATHLKEFQTVYGGSGTTIINAQWIKSNFCPNCGADMREEEKE